MEALHLRDLRPAYATWDELPFRVYIEAQKIVADRYKPEQGRNTLVEIELLILLYGLTEEQLARVDADDVPAMWQAVSQFALARPPILEDLATFNYFGKTYHIEREPRNISVLALKAIEEYRAIYPDPWDLMLVHCALLVAPEAFASYGTPGSAAPFTVERAHQWQVIRDWPTPVCYTLHAFFLRHWLRTKVLSPLSTSLSLTTPMAEAGDSTA